jgi:hypothetical protein
MTLDISSGPMVNPPAGHREARCANKGNGNDFRRCVDSSVELPPTVRTPERPQGRRGLGALQRFVLQRMRPAKL